MVDYSPQERTGGASAVPDNTQEYAAALRTIARTRRLFLSLLILSLLVHAGVYSAAR